MESDCQLVGDAIMARRRQPENLEALSKTVREFVFGPNACIGPFPDGFPKLQELIEEQPMSEYQKGLAEALKRHLAKFQYAQRQPDGVIRYVRLDREIFELEHRNVIRYLSRLLLSYARDDPSERATKRPDTLVWACHDAARSMDELADAFEADGKDEAAREYRSLAEQWRQAGAIHEGKRARVGRGRRSPLPTPETVARELQNVADWLRPRWGKIRTSQRDRLLWARELHESVLAGLVGGPTVKPDDLVGILWSSRTLRGPASAAVHILAAVYSVSPRAVANAKKIALKKT